MYRLYLVYIFSIWTKDKSIMNAGKVVDVLFDSDNNSNWNGSDEERENWLEEGSFRMDRLSMELGKMADTLGSTYSSILFIRQCEKHG